MAERPTGVTIISLLGFLGGIISVLSGIAFLIAGGIAGTFGGFAGILGVLGTAAGLLVFVLGTSSCVWPLEDEEIGTLHPDVLTDNRNPDEHSYRDRKSSLRNRRDSDFGSNPLLSLH